MISKPGFSNLQEKNFFIGEVLNLQKKHLNVSIGGGNALASKSTSQLNEDLPSVQIRDIDKIEVTSEKLFSYW